MMSEFDYHLRRHAIGLEFFAACLQHSRAMAALYREAGKTEYIGVEERHAAEVEDEIRAEEKEVARIEAAQLEAAKAAERGQG